MNEKIEGDFINTEEQQKIWDNCYSMEIFPALVQRLKNQNNKKEAEKLQKFLDAGLATLESYNNRTDIKENYELMHKTRDEFATWNIEDVYSGIDILDYMDEAIKHWRIMIENSKEKGGKREKSRKGKK